MNVAFIPVRGGSKSIPLKNIKILNGKPLVYWTAKAACLCKYIDKVYVSTDSEKIRCVIQKFCKDEEGLFRKIEVIGRSRESASDTASTEQALLEFGEKYNFSAVALIQATSPLLEANDLDRGFEAFSTPGTDSVMSAVLQKRFYWQYMEKGYIRPVNYDYHNRPRRQEMEGELVENGAFYIISRERLLCGRNRMSGNIKAIEMDSRSFFEVDEIEDWIIVEQLMKEKGWR